MLVLNAISCKHLPNNHATVLSTSLLLEEQQVVITPCVCCSPNFYVSELCLSFLFWIYTHAAFLLCCLYKCFSTRGPWFIGGPWRNM